MKNMIFSGFVFAIALSGFAAAAVPSGVTNVVLVHGAFADGSGWAQVASALRNKGYTVSVVQEPETSFADDVKATQRVLDLQAGPTILVGHSYGGAIITEAGNHKNVVGLVYVAAAQPDVGETTELLFKKMPAAATSTKATADGFLYLDPSAFPADFAADLPAELAHSMAYSQVFVAATCFSAPITSAAWRNKPSWALIAGADRAINPDLERWMAKRANSKIVELTGSSHAAYISHPRDVVEAVVEAAITKQDSRTKKLADPATLRP